MKKNTGLVVGLFLSLVFVCLPMIWGPRRSSGPEEAIGRADGDRGQYADSRTAAGPNRVDVSAREPESNGDSIASEDSGAITPEPLVSEEHDRSLEASFLTSYPDLEGLRGRIGALADGASVLEETLKWVGDSLSGQIELSDGTLAEFQVDAGRDFRISLNEIHPPESGGQFLLSETTIGFSADEVSVRNGFGSLSFHPNSRGEPPPSPSIVGWGMRISEEGAIAIPTVARQGASEGAWSIGPDNNQAIRREWDYSREEFEIWRRMLSRYTSK